MQACVRVVAPAMPAPELRARSQLLAYPRFLFNRHRMAIMLELYNAGALEFVQLRLDLRTNDGALATHLNALVNGGVITRHKEDVDGKNRTVFLITRKGIRMVRQFFATLNEEGKAIAVE